MRSNSRIPSRRLPNLLALFLASVVSTGLVACGTDEAPPAQRDGDTPAAQAAQFVDAELGRSVGGDRSITDATDEFAPNDTIYVSVETEGTASSASLVARWTYQDGQEIDRSEATISPRGREHTEFHISKPDGWPAGEYQVEISLDGRAVEVLDFEVAG